MLLLYDGDGRRYYSNVSLVIIVGIKCLLQFRFFGFPVGQVYQEYFLL